MKPHLAKALAAYGSGFHFSAPSPPGVENLANLRSDDPDDVIGCVLLHLQRGRFEVADALLPVLQRTDGTFVWGAATTLLTYAAPKPTIREFFAWASSHPDASLRLEACGVALLAGYRWAVEPTLNLLPEIRDLGLRATARTELSWLLEQAPGRVYAEPPDVEVRDPDDLPWHPPRTAPDESVYAGLVRDRMDELTRAPGLAADTPLAEGEPTSVVRVARRMLDRLAERELCTPRMEHAGLLFSAATGLDLWSLYDGSGIRDRAHAAAILLRFLDSTAEATFEPGGRYFFGHRIPG
jgi:hypothetical protein